MLTKNIKREMFAFVRARWNFQVRMLCCYTKLIITVYDKKGQIQLALEFKKIRGRFSGSCFDLEQIHVLPKSAVEGPYYSRQTGFCKPKIERPQFSVRAKDQAGKGSSEVPSALLCHPKSLNFNK